MPDRRIAIDIRPLVSAAAAAADVEALLDRTFGPDRRQRTAYLIRAGMPPFESLNFAAFLQGRLVGTIQCWPIALHLDSGGAASLVMVGPVAIAPEQQGMGYGRALMAAMKAAAEAYGLGEALMLIGDPEFYGRFGFSAHCTAQWRTPGPVEQHRLLAGGCNVPDTSGMLGPRR